jgi:hypothetical protein
MKHLVLYDAGTGKILNVFSKTQDLVGIVSGTGTLVRNEVAISQVLSGDLSSVRVGDAVGLDYEVIKKISSRRIVRDAEGKMVLTPGGMPQNEPFTQDFTVTEPMEATLVVCNEIKLEIDKTVAFPETSTKFRVTRYVPSTGFTDEEVAQILAVNDPQASVLKVTTDRKIEPAEWLVDLVSLRLIRNDDFQYE